MSVRSFKFVVLFLLFFRTLSHAGETSMQSTSSLNPPVVEGAGDENETHFFDIRIRPLAAAQGVPGAELGFNVTRRFELGPALHYFHGLNDVRESEVSSWELGLKANYLVYSPSPYEGAYLSFGLYDYISQVSSLQPTIRTNHFPDFGYTFTAGYQWNLGDLNLFQKTAWTVKVGAGVGYRDDYIETLQTPSGPAPYGLDRRLEPTLEMTMGLWI